jgi:hypothetical protein
VSSAAAVALDADAAPLRSFSITYICGAGASLKHRAASGGMQISGSRRNRSICVPGGAFRRGEGGPHMSRVRQADVEHPMTDLQHPDVEIDPVATAAGCR